MIPSYILKEHCGEMKVASGGIWGIQGTERQLQECPISSGDS